MSVRTPIEPTNAGAVAAFAASEVAGDLINYRGGDLLVEFQNTHVSSITVNIAPTQTSKKVSGAGRVTIPTRSLAIAATAFAIFRFSQEDINAYLNVNGQIPITYTSGNVALLLRALKV